MFLGSHNSMSYLKPKWFWFMPFRFIARCQDKTIEEQYKAGARLFDLRIAFDNNGTPFFAHGAIAFAKSSVYDVLKWLDSCDDKVYVRILNERNKNFGKFVQFCSYVQAEFKNILFVGGRNKKDWKQLFDFGNSLDFIDKYSSWNNDTHLGTGWILDDFWPRAYAFCLNKHWKEKYKNQDVWLMLDFVGVY